MTNAIARNALEDAKIEGVADGEEIAGVFDGPQWVPHFNNWNADEMGKRVAALKGKAVTRMTLAGRLSVGSTFGERRYFLDVAIVGKEPVRVELPTHGPLYKALGFVKLGGKVEIVYKGLGTARQGQSKPHIYSVKPEKTAILNKQRDDALQVHFRGTRRGHEIESDAIPYSDAADSDVPQD